MSGSVSKVVIHTYFSTKGNGVTPPSKAEGFAEVIDIPYVCLDHNTLKGLLSDHSKNAVDRSGLKGPSVL